MGRRTIKRGVPAKRIRAIKPDTRKTPSSAVSLRQQLERHARELDEAREQQTATVKSSMLFVGRPRMPNRYSMPLLKVPRACAAPFSALSTCGKPAAFRLLQQETSQPRQPVRFARNRISRGSPVPMPVAVPSWIEQSFTFRTCLPMRNTRANTHLLEGGGLCSRSLCYMMASRWAPSR